MGIIFRPLLALILFVAAAQSADLAGTWKTVYTNTEGQVRESMLALVVQGGSVTGTISSVRGTVPLAEGKVEGNRFSFVVSRIGNEDNIPIKFTGTFDGDRMKMQMQIRDREPLAVTGTRVAQLVQFLGKTKYLNNTKAVVTHNIDDSTKYVTAAVDAMDKYGIKSTIFISTDEDPAPEERFLTQLMVKDLWPRLRKAIENGHEIGSHSQTHPCRRQETDAACGEAYTQAEIAGSRDEILKQTKQPYVWTWCYPCGTCANLPMIQKRIAAAGYIVARNYPDERHDGHIMPNLQTWDANPFNAAYTQVVQKRGGAARTEILDMGRLNGKFDEIYAKGGIYNFMSHPQWLDFGPEGFYEKHLSYVSRKPDVWYVPMGPLYAFKTIYDRTEIRQLDGSHFTVANNLDPKIYSGTLTLDFKAPAAVTVMANGKPMAAWKGSVTDGWNDEYVRRDGEHLYVTVHANTTLEFREAGK